MNWETTIAAPPTSNKDKFVFPSESENFPIVLLEAMVAGLAIITTKGTGCAEVVGDTAILVEPRNSNEISSALQKMIEDDELCASMGRKARERVENNYGWPSILARTTLVYSEVVDEL